MSLWMPYDIHHNVLYIVRTAPVMLWLAWFSSSALGLGFESLSGQAKNYKLICTASPINTDH